MTIHVSPDGERLLGLARGEPQPRPFAYRWLVPWLLGCSARAWVWTSRLSMAALCLLAVAYTHSWYALPIPLALSGLTLNLKLPVLIDGPAMALGLGAAVCLQHGWWIPAIALVLAAGATKETTPVFAALWAWNPLLLVGLAAPALRHLVRPGDDTRHGVMADALIHPWQTSQEAHAGKWRNPFVWLLPWGVLLVGLGHPTWQLALCVVVAYGQCLIATDTTRLYMWCWPILAARTFAVVPHSWWLTVVVLAFANPFGGTGI